MNARADTHSKLIGYLLWIFGFTVSHRLYFARGGSKHKHQSPPQTRARASCSPS